MSWLRCQSSPRYMLEQAEWALRPDLALAEAMHRHRSWPWPETIDTHLRNIRRHAEECARRMIWC